jgi:trehalose synthase
MALVNEVEVGCLPTERFREVLPEDSYEDFERSAARGRELLAGRTVWNINSTARGGGVAEMLRSLLAYAEGVGVTARWLVISGEPDFFRVTKRIHNNLHGAPGDGGDLGSAEKAIYERVTAANAAELAGFVKEGDVALVHDPQPAGLIQPLLDAGVTVIWRCHVGLDTPNEVAKRAWSFLMPYIAPAAAYVFSREAYVWEGLDPERRVIVPPSIDAFSPKNQMLDDATVESIMVVSGLLGGASPEAPPVYTRVDGTSARVENQAMLVDGGPPPNAGDRLVVQVSRWDRLKDPVGVINGFAEHVVPKADAHLIVAGPAVDAVSDDPEGAEVLEESRVAWEALSDRVKGRIHLAGLPMDDGEENAAIVNALQRRAEVVVQKSLAEGFGLTVAEAMWKSRPVVASGIGGIQDQIIDDDCGELISDPLDLAEYGGLVTGLLNEPNRAAAMGARALERVREHFLGARHLMQYVDLIERLL